MRRLLITSALLATLGCASSKPPQLTPEGEAELERLRALGYVDYAAEPAADASGVTIHDPERVHPGYNLYTVRALGRAELVDLDGNLLHSWSEAYPRIWTRSFLKENGELLVVLFEGGVLHFDWDGRFLERYPLQAHHDVRPTPDGRLVTLTMELRELDSIHSDFATEDHSLTLFGPGIDVEHHSLHDAIATSPGILSFREIPPLKRRVNLIHANSVRFLTDERLEARHPLYATGNVLVCMRNLDAIAILDPEMRRLVWAWGQDELEGPHDATMLPSGNILVFDNGTRRKWSRVVELDPVSGEIVWEYRAPEPAEFFTAARGSAQRLPNGNTLISDSDSGRGFEVTRDGEIVWEYRVPHLDERGHRAAIVRFYRFEAGMIEPLLAD